MRYVRPLLVAALAVTAAGVLPADAPAAVKRARCNTSFDLPGARCGTLTVPLDRGGAVRGKVNLFFERLPARRKPKAAIVPFPGGPGLATSILGGEFMPIVRRSLRDHDLLLFDQRGTGRSDYLDCDEALTPTYYRPATENARQLAKTVERCAKRLGKRRSFYTTRDTVEDLEALREALGIDKLVLLGVSYGTRAATAYARKYPQHVERIILDSVVADDGVDAFPFSTFRAIPRVLQQLCRGGGCEAFTQDVVADLRTLVARLAQGPLRARQPVTLAGCRLRPAITRSRLLALFQQADVDPEMLSRLPVAIAAAARGRPYQLSVLLATNSPYLGFCGLAEILAEILGPDSRGLRDDIRVLERSFSTGVQVATLCEEGLLPWPRSAPVPTRGRLAEQALEPFGDDAFAPFDRATMLAAGLAQLCKFWVAAPEWPTLPQGPLPGVPTLVVAGLDDLRTPAEDALAVARQAPRGHLLLVPDVGHSVLTNSGCARRGMRRFMADQPIGQCHRWPQHRPQPARRVPSLQHTIEELLAELPLD